MPKAKKIKLADPLMAEMHRDHQYVSRELDEANRKAREVDSASLSERQEAREDFYRVMAEDPARVAERVGWIIDGTHGYGVMLQAKRIIASPRMNRRAALTHLVAIHEWNCPGKFAVDAWKKLTGEQKRTLDAALDVVIDAAEQEMIAEQGA